MDKGAQERERMEAASALSSLRGPEKEPEESDDEYLYLSDEQVSAKADYIKRRIGLLQTKLTRLNGILEARKSGQSNARLKSCQTEPNATGLLMQKSHPSASHLSQGEKLFLDQQLPRSLVAHERDDSLHEIDLRPRMTSQNELPPGQTSQPRSGRLESDSPLGAPRDDGFLERGALTKRAPLKKRRPPRTPKTDSGHKQAEPSTPSSDLDRKKIEASFQYMWTFHGGEGESDVTKEYLRMTKNRGGTHHSQLPGSTGKDSSTRFQNLKQLPQAISTTPSQLPPASSTRTVAETTATTGSNNAVPTNPSLASARALFGKKRVSTPIHPNEAGRNNRGKLKDATLLDCPVPAANTIAGTSPRTINNKTNTMYRRIYKEQEPVPLLDTVPGGLRQTAANGATVSFLQADQTRQPRQIIPPTNGPILSTETKFGPTATAALTELSIGDRLALLQHQSDLERLLESTRERNAALRSLVSQQTSGQPLQSPHPETGEQLRLFFAQQVNDDTMPTTCLRPTAVSEFGNSSETLHHTNSQQRLQNSKASSKRARKKQKTSHTELITPSPGTTLAYKDDPQNLSGYQILVRQCLELFSAEQLDVEKTVQGRKKKIQLGQVGVRCKFCATIPPSRRGKSSVFYPLRLEGVYQAAQSMASTHLCGSCLNIPGQLREQLLMERQRRDYGGGGKPYWVLACKEMGLEECETGLWFDTKVRQGDGTTKSAPLVGDSAAV